MDFHGEIKDGYDITEHTGIGRMLYDIAKSEDVSFFLEIGTQIGGSARCIASGLKETVGELHTIEAIKSRSEQAAKNLKDLPVTCHWGATTNTGQLKRYYSHSADNIPEADGLLERLLETYQFDAIFLDSCVASQYHELKTIIDSQHPIHIAMHEPDAKCPDYEKYMKDAGYKLISSGNDKIGSHNPLWVYYRYDE